ncbi:MAG: low molecular weight protein-tyrosine-phosphatase [Pseudomonadota bacterium]
MRATTNPKNSVLFVCMGNICRSPTAEGVFRARVPNLAAWLIDSAGTHAYHVGEPPDPRSIAAAAERGYDLTPLKARRVADDDYFRFDLIIAMDGDNLANLTARMPDGATAKLALLSDYSANPDLRGRDVPDPYYGGARGFDRVLDMIEDAVDPLRADVERQTAG